MLSAGHGSALRYGLLHVTDCAHSLDDNNPVTLSASTGLTFTEDRAKRFEACGWPTILAADGNDVAAIDAAIDAARADTS